jgi:histidine ammonia-lyase
MCAAQAMDLFTNMKSGEGTLAAYKVIREAVAHLDKDRILSQDIEIIRSLMRGGRVIKEVERVVGRLH